MTWYPNIEFQAAMRELIGFPSADDVLLPGDAERRSSRRWLAGGDRWIGSSGQSLGNFQAAPHGMTWRMRAACDFTPISPLAAYIYQEFFLEYGGDDERYEVAPKFSLFARPLRRERFERIDGPTACSRSHGQNNSVVHRDDLVSEGYTVRESFVTRNDFTRSLLSYTMKAWFHLSNPGCCTGKMSDKVRLRLEMAQVAY
jgi:hypothetical protein